MPAPEDQDVDLITVGKPVDDGKAVWDQHELHPANYEQEAGEVFISDMRPYKVYRSSGIQQKLGEKPPALRELRDQDASARLEKHDEGAKTREERRQEILSTREEAGGAATWVAPGAAAPSRQEAPEGEAEAATEGAEGQQAAPLRRPSRAGSPDVAPPPPSTPGAANR